MKGDYLKTRAGIEERYVLRPNLSAWQAVKVNQEGTSFLGSRFFLNLSENERIPSNIGGLTNNNNGFIERDLIFGSKSNGKAHLISGLF